MESELVIKLESIISKETKITESDTISFLVKTRKLLDLTHLKDGGRYLTLRLFCNWIVHNKITDSNTGLRILCKVNSALANAKTARSTIEMMQIISDAIGFSVLRSELTEFLNSYSLSIRITSDLSIWAVFIGHVISIIKDVPIAFPPLESLKPDKQRIYDEISQNAIKTGAGVISICLTLIEQERLGLCLKILTADTTTVVVPIRTGLL